MTQNWLYEYQFLVLIVYHVWVQSADQIDFVIWEESKVSITKGSYITSFWITSVPPLSRVGEDLQREAVRCFVLLTGRGERRAGGEAADEKLSDNTFPVKSWRDTVNGAECWQGCAVRRGREAAHLLQRELK